jgi:hypothetical protein
MKAPIFKNLFLTISTVAALTSCGQQTFDVIDTHDQNTAAGSTSIAPKIDIVLAVDNSGSTLQIQNQLNASIRSFLTGLNQQNWDFRVTAVPLLGTPNIGTISASKYDANSANWVAAYPGAPRESSIPSFLYVAPEQYSVVLNSASSTGHEPGLKNIGEFLSIPTIKNQFLRPDAALAVVVLSNGDDSSEAVDYSAWPYLAPSTVAENLVSKIRDAKGSALSGNVHLIPVVSTANRSTCIGGAASRGTRYMYAASRIGRQSTIDICTNSMTSVLASLKTQLQEITLNFTKRFLQISKEPNVSTIRVTKYAADGRVINVPQSVNGSAGWRYIGYTTAPMVSHPIEMDFRTGYMIELVGGVYDLVGKDTAKVDFTEYGVNPSK